MKYVERFLPILLAVVTVMAALNKILSTEFRDKLAEQINVSGTFLIIVGVFELMLAADLLTSRLRVVGGLGVTATMIGAAIFDANGQVVDGSDPKSVIPTNVMIAIVGLIVAWMAAGRPNTARELVGTGIAQMRGMARR